MLGICVAVNTCAVQARGLTRVVWVFNRADGLPPGWASVVSRPPAPRHPDQAPPKHWLVFEVMDTGVWGLCWSQSAPALQPLRQCACCSASLHQPTRSTAGWHSCNVQGWPSTDFVASPGCSPAEALLLQALASRSGGCGRCSRSTCRAARRTCGGRAPGGEPASACPSAASRWARQCSAPDNASALICC